MLYVRSQLANTPDTTPEDTYVEFAGPVHYWPPEANCGPLFGTVGTLRAGASQPRVWTFSGSFRLRGSGVYPRVFIPPPPPCQAYYHTTCKITRSPH